MTSLVGKPVTYINQGSFVVRIDGFRVGGWTAVSSMSASRDAPGEVTLTRRASDDTSAYEWLAKGDSRNVVVESTHRLDSTDDNWIVRYEYKSCKPTHYTTPAMVREDTAKSDDGLGFESITFQPEEWRVVSERNKSKSGAPVFHIG